METFKENALFLIYSSIPYTQNILEAQEVHADFLNFFNPVFPKKTCTIPLNWNKRNVHTSIGVKMVLGTNKETVFQTTDKLEKDF